MKNIKLLLLLCLGSVSAYSQTPTYEYRLINDIQVSDSIYEFDIYLLQTGSTTLEVANTQVGVNFNNSIRNGGTLTFSLNAGTSEFNSSQIPSSFSVDTANHILRIAPKSNPGAGNGTIISSTGNGTRFGRFKVRNTVPFATVTPNLSWNFTSSGGKYPSRLSAYVSGTAVDITDSTEYFVNLSNPTLNASISGRKFNDLNGNGILDAGEPGLANWRIRLSQGGVPVDSTLTDANGDYALLNLSPGTYTVTEQVQTGWILTSTPSSYTITVTNGSFSPNNSFGNFQLGSTRGQIFNDVNGNGVKDAGEAGLSGWRVRLSKSGVQVDSTLTDGSGNYTFSSMTSGTYIVSGQVQSGWTQTLPPSSGTYTVTITSGTNSTGNDFGNFQFGSISGMKFVDLNGNGIKDNGEGGLQGWQIKLSGSASGNTTTDANGNYVFSNLLVGTYTVTEVSQNGWTQSFPSSGSYSIVVSSGTNATNKDFGNFQASSITGTKFNDVNKNGARDLGEPGLSGWRIRLSKNSVPVDSALTDGSGNYSFVGLVPGAHTVSEASQIGWEQTFPSPSGQYSLALTSGSVITGKDFGNFQPASISGIKFNDINGNGQRDTSDPVLSGWRIRLIRGGLEVDSALTDVNGAYQFQDLPTATYTVSEATQSGWVQTAPLSPGTYTVLLTSGVNVTGENFGNFQLGSISGVKFNDLNGNGIRDAGEPGLSGWRIRLSIGGNQVDSVVTDTVGNYLFANLAAGAYTVSEAFQSGWVQTSPVSPATYAITINSGTVSTGKDFGNFHLGSISGIDFIDLNANAVKDSAEPGLTNWRIRLYKGGVEVDSTLTSSDGTYSFAGMTGGTYVVGEALQNGWTQSLPTGSGTYTVVISSGSSASAKDFGNYQRVSVAGKVFTDLNGNGVKDSADTGTLGVLVRLSGTRIDSLLTDAQGNYVFANLIPGAYAVQEVPPGGWIHTVPAPPGIYNVTLTSGMNVTAKDFGNFQRGTIHGLVFNDLNGNGVKDSIDPVLANWRVYLKVGTTPVDSILTDTSGMYAFSSLGPGTYQIGEQLQAGWAQIDPVSQGEYSVVVTSGLNAVNKNFGVFQLGSISGMMFNDANGNGRKDGTEIGLVGWNIKLSGVKVDSVITDSAGNFRFNDLYAGSYTVAEELRDGWYETVPVSPGNYTLTIVSGRKEEGILFGSTTLAPVFGSVRKRWNMVSVPIIPSDSDYRKVTLFPSAHSDAFGYNGQYLTYDTLRNGSGYWLKFDSAQAISLSGKLLVQDTIEVSNGWNMIGALSHRISVATVASDSQVTISSGLFGYNGMYKLTDTLEPFQGYWIKVNGAGRLYMSQSPHPLKSHTVITSAEVLGASLREFNHLEITDATGNSQTLYFGTGDDHEMSKYELPPLPPDVVFDVRFASGGFAEIGTDSLRAIKKDTILVNAEKFPLRLGWHLKADPDLHYEISFIDGNKKLCNVPLVRDGELSLANASITKLILTITSESPLPKEFSLEQNFPNPFNPTTQIRYNLPKLSHVQLTIYNVLGQVVERLVDVNQEAGRYVKAWAPSVASGVYYCRLIVRSLPEQKQLFIGVKKMLLLR